MLENMKEIIAEQLSVDESEIATLILLLWRQILKMIWEQILWICLNW